MFGKSMSPKSLPPTSDALKLHIERAHFQANVWKQANVVKPILPGNLAFLQLHRNVIQPEEHWHDIISRHTCGIGSSVVGSGIKRSPSKLN
jgi:hypothetical protein